jgi:hypothetical protein
MNDSGPPLSAWRPCWCAGGSGRGSAALGHESLSYGLPRAFLRAVLLLEGAGAVFRTSANDKSAYASRRISSPCKAVATIALVIGHISVSRKTAVLRKPVGDQHQDEGWHLLCKHEERFELSRMPWRRFGVIRKPFSQRSRFVMWQEKCQPAKRQVP